MRICAAQTKAVKGSVAANIINHKKLINLAEFDEADAIFFPELSLTGYEPDLAESLATNLNDERFADFQAISDERQLTIGVGMPTKADSGILISMIIFEPHQPRQIYSKQHLHSDEKPYFIAGGAQLILTVKNMKIAPAICYESLLPEHSENANKCAAEIYLASVAKSDGGIGKAFKHYPEIAKKYLMPVLMSNAVGYCDNFESVGQTSVWDGKGNLAGQLDDKSEGILIFDSDTQKTVTRTI